MRDGFKPAAAEYIKNNGKAAGMKIRIIMLSAIMVSVICLGPASCNNSQNTDETSAVATAVTTTAGSTSYPDEQPVGCYKRFSIVKDGETFEEMLELRDDADKGFLILNEDWTAYFELDGERMEYTYDKKNLYLKEDTERSSGFSYVYIGGRLVVDKGAVVEQYMKLTDDELEYYLEHGSLPEITAKIS